MATDNHFINFNLRNPKAKESTIHFIVRWRGNRYVGNANSRINPKHWTKGQRANTGLPKQTTKQRDAYKAINKRLDIIRDTVDQIFETYLEQNGVTPDLATFRQYVKDALNKQDSQAETTKMTLLYFIDNVMPTKTFATKEGLKTVTPQTVRNYKQTGRLLREFGAKYRMDIDFDTINTDFYNKFVPWMQTKPVKGRRENSMTVGGKNDLGHTSNFIGKTINNIKSIMNYAVEKGYTDNLAFKDKKFISPIDERIDHIYLNVAQLDEMWSLSFTSDEPHLEIARDLFLISAWTGLRFSDLETFNEHARFDNPGQITIVTQKTGQEVTIPLIDPPVKSIMDKYEGRLPHMFNQKANKHIKTVAARLEGFDKEITLTRTEGGAKVTRVFQRSGMVSMHTARRSFATNMVQTFGVSPFNVMKITGHKTFAVFDNYIKSTASEVADQIAAKVNELRNPQMKIS